MPPLGNSRATPRVTHEEKEKSNKKSRRGSTRVRNVMVLLLIISHLLDVSCPEVEVEEEEAKTSPYVTISRVREEETVAEEVEERNPIIIINLAHNLLQIYSLCRFPIIFPVTSHYLSCATHLRAHKHLLSGQVLLLFS